MRSFFLVCLVAVCVAASACSSGPGRSAIPALPQAMPVDPPGGSHMLTANTYAGDALHAMLLLRMDSGGGILTTSFVDISDFERTSTFGRVASQQVGSRLGQYGFRVIEARLATTLNMVPRSGEFMLTRETARLLADTYDAHSVLIGTYSAESGRVFVSARVVRLADNVIMGAYEYYLPRNGDVARLLENGAKSGAGGGSVWNAYNSRVSSFGSPSGGARVETVASPAAPSAAPAARSDKAVPRYVDPNAKAPAPAKKTAPAAKAAPVASAPAAPASAAPVPAVSGPATPGPAPGPVPVPAPAAPTPIPSEKDAPAPPSIPGGA